MSTTANITNFTTAPNTQFQIGGDTYSVQGAGRSYSLTNPDPQTLQFKIQPGDYAWFDGSSVDRSEISGSYIPAGTPVGIDYQFMVQPNGPNNRHDWREGQSAHACTSGLSGHFDLSARNGWRYAIALRMPRPSASSNVHKSSRL